VAKYVSLHSSLSDLTVSVSTVSWL